MKAFLIGLGVVIVFGGFWMMGSYNGLVSSSQNVDTAWANVETQYQRRFDLVPNLVAATKGVLKQEQTVFGDIAKARTQYAGTQPGSADRAQAIQGYDSAISRLLLVVENYPQLQSAQTVKDLMTELSGTENRINIARDRYNLAVQTYNVKVRSFPGSMFASLFGFAPRQQFEADQGAQAAPAVNLTD